MSESAAAPPSPPGRRTRALRRRRLRRYVAASAALLLLLVAVVGALLSRSPGAHDPQRRPTAAASPTPVPLDRVDLSGLSIARGPFCQRLREADVARALGAPATGTAHYTAGERVQLAPGVRDLSDEYDCTFRGAAGGEARAWVFARPVPARVARGIVAGSRGERGCAVVRGGPRFGIPSLTTRCRAGGASARSVTLRGLFGDTWLSCRLTLPGAGADEIVRAQRWCVQVATSVGVRP